MSIKKSLQLSIVLISIIPVIIMTICAYIVSTNRYEQITQANCTTVSQDYAYGFSSQLKAQEIETTSLANTNDIKSLLLQKVNTPGVLIDTTSSLYERVKDSITQFSNTMNNHVNYSLYDIDGYLVVSSNSSSISDWTEIMDTDLASYTETVVIPNSHFTENTLDIIAPVIVRGELIGLVRANVSAEYFGAFLSTTNVNSFLIDEDLDFLFGYQPNTADDQLFYDYIPEITKNTSFSHIEKMNSVFTGSPNYLYGYCIIPEYNFMYVIRQSSSIYSSIVSSLPIVLLVVLAIVSIVAYVLSRNLATQYTKPIMELSENMQKAADGDLTVSSSIQRNDEFGSLSTNFNNMMAIISHNYNDITEAQVALEESQQQLQRNYEDIERLVFTDALTGLYNRMAFFKYAPEVLADRSNGFTTHAVIFIDLDGFKGINDTLGHDYGDLLLQAVSAQLSTYINDDDILARNGGDEFVILRNQVQSQDELEEFLNKLVSIANTPFVLNDETVHITLSAGASVFPQNGLSLNELMKNADIAMYTSKSSGKNSYTFFSSAMEDEVNRRNALIEILHNSIAKKEISLLYQPQANVTTGEIIGCEALMRLNSPDLGFISPEEFIPLAEECGLIDELGEWALLEACTFNQSLIEAGFKPIKMSVNVSTIQLQGTRLIEAIKSVHEKTNMPLEYLEIELTESVLMKNFDHHLSLITQMKEMGIKIALDDFGTGYSSFSYLRKIPFDTLKIDKLFIAEICEAQDARYISDTIINLSHQLGINVVAEGVENVDQLRIMQEQKCDILQGYLFSRPISNKDFIELLQINTSY